MGGEPRNVEVLEAVEVCEANVRPSWLEVSWIAFRDFLGMGEMGWGSRSARGRFIVFQLLQSILSAIELLVRRFTGLTSVRYPPDAQRVGA